MSNPTTPSGLFDCRMAFASAMDDLAAQDDRILLLVNDSVSSSAAGGFARKHPKRMLNIGIAEQNMVGIAAGLANGGKLPFVSAATCFLTGRATEQIKADICYSNANVKLIGQSSGVTYGVLGATHHSIEDIAWTRALGNLTVIVPADPAETNQSVRWAASHRGPVFIRLSRIGVPELHDADYHFEIGKASLLRNGTDVTLIACGVMSSRAVGAADVLAAQGVSARVLNMASIRPLDRDAIIAAARQTGAIVTIEEHSVRGGLGGAVAEVVVEACPVPMRILGITGDFAPASPPDVIFERYGLTSAGIVRAVRELLPMKPSGR